MDGLVFCASEAVSQKQRLKTLKFQSLGVCTRMSSTGARKEGRRAQMESGLYNFGRLRGCGHDKNFYCGMYFEKLMVQHWKGEQQAGIRRSVS